MTDTTDVPRKPRESDFADADAFDTALDEYYANPMVVAHLGPGSTPAQTGQEVMAREFGSLAAAEHFARTGEILPGRPPVGSRPTPGPSPSVRARIARDDYDRLVALAEKTGRTQSDLVREGIHRLLNA